MVSLDVLQFNYYVDNEIARNDIKNFAEVLEKAFEQHKKLWNEYLKLRKHCKDANFKIPFQLLEPDNCNVNAVTTADTSQKPSENGKLSIHLCENVPSSISSTLSPYVDAQSENDDSKQNEGNELLKSPILVKKHGQHNNFNTSDRVLVDLEKDKEEKENFLVDETNDQIECTPISKTSKRLRISKLCNVETTILQNGKKLRQSKLLLFPDKQSVNTANHKMYSRPECLKSYTPERNEKMNKIEFQEEEIIQGSPSKNVKSQFRKRNLQLKRKLMDEKANDKSDTFTDKSNSGTKLSTSEITKSKRDQYLSTTYTSKSKTNSYNKNEKCNNIVLNSYALSNTENLSVPLQAIKNEIITQKEENVSSDLPTQLLNASSSQGDETFFEMDDQDMKKFNSNKNMLEDIENNTSKQEMLSENPAPKKRCISNLNIFPEKEVIYYDKIPKTKSEREKLNGVTCWECKEYYEALGLSEGEIQAKKNQCSRHRSFFPQRPPTPEGFWNHLFPDTLSSTYAE